MQKQVHRVAFLERCWWMLFIKAETNIAKEDKQLRCDVWENF